MGDLQYQLLATLINQIIITTHTPRASACADNHSHSARFHLCQGFWLGSGSFRRHSAKVAFPNTTFASWKKKILVLELLAVLTAQSQCNCVMEVSTTSCKGADQEEKYFLWPPHK